MCQYILHTFIQQRWHTKHFFADGRKRIKIVILVQYVAQLMNNITHIGLTTVHMYELQNGLNIESAQRFSRLFKNID